MAEIITNGDASIKINLRLNKSDSSDVDFIWKEVKEEALNKAAIEILRRLIRRRNQSQEGDEETLGRLDDLQMFLKNKKLSSKRLEEYNKTDKIPTDYFSFKRLTPKIITNSCTNKYSITAYPEEEANIDLIKHYDVSSDFEETVFTMVDNRIHVYHMNQFEIEELLITYYRYPKYIDLNKLDKPLEFKKDLAEIVIDEAIKILSGDIESINQKMLAQERVENNN